MKFKNNFISSIYPIYLFYIYIYIQQIKEEEARYLCHTYKCMLKKTREKKKIWKDGEEDLYFNNVLPKDVENAAKKLCRCILRYKGIVDLVLFQCYAKQIKINMCIIHHMVTFICQILFQCMLEPHG